MRVRFDKFRRFFDAIFGRGNTPTGIVIEHRFVHDLQYLHVVLDEPLVSAAGAPITALWVNRLWVSEFPAESEGLR